jgi:hypothetical protein
MLKKIGSFTTFLKIHFLFSKGGKYEEKIRGELCTVVQKCARKRGGKHK